MIGEDRVVTSGTELRRVPVVRQVLDQRITQVKVGTLMGLTDRQIRASCDGWRRRATRGWLLAQGVTHFFGTRRRPQKVRRSFRQPSVRYAA